MTKTKTVSADVLLQQQADHVDAKKQHEVDELVRGLKRDLRAKTGQYDELLDAFQDFKTAAQYMDFMDREFAEPAVIKPESRSGQSESVAVAVATDWHAFESVKPEQVNGLNEYTPDICRRSAESFFKTVCRWIEIARGGTKIDTMVMAFLGDLITSMIHEDKIEGNAGTPLEESLFVADLVIGGLDHLLKNSGCKQIHVVSCDGNHSRITIKKRKANRVKHSLEWLLFNFIQRHYEAQGEKRLKFTITPGYHLYVPFDFSGGKTIRFHHGDEGIRYMGGVGGLAVPAQRQIKIWNKGRNADLDIFGHHHTSEFPRNYIAVGSLMGYSPFSITGKYEFERPQQVLVTIEKKRWITGYHPIYVR